MTGPPIRAQDQRLDKPSRAIEAAFTEAVEAISLASERLLDQLVTKAPPKNREVEAAKAKARSEKRFAAAGHPAEAQTLSSGRRCRAVAARWSSQVPQQPPQTSMFGSR